MTSRPSIAERTLKSQADRIRVSIDIIKSEINKLAAQKSVLYDQVEALEAECVRLRSIQEQTPLRTKS